MNNSINSNYENSLLKPKNAMIDKLAQKLRKSLHNTNTNRQIQNKLDNNKIKILEIYDPVIS